jgi:hypothetical protein
MTFFRLLDLRRQGGREGGGTDNEWISGFLFRRSTTLSPVRACGCTFRTALGLSATLAEKARDGSEVDVCGNVYVGVWLNAYGLSTRHGPCSSGRCPAASVA